MPVGAHLIDGKAIAQGMRAALAVRVGDFCRIAGRAPGLAVVLASEDPDSSIYVRSKTRAAEEVGIQSALHTLPSTIAPESLLAYIDALNQDPGVDGILVQLPLPQQHDPRRVIEHVAPEKDVDGLHPINAGRLARGDESGLLPCTPQGCIRLIEASAVQIARKRAVVVGRSNLVGRPVADLLSNRDATVTLCHSKTEHLAELVASAEILIAAIGRPEFILGRWIRPGATVIDVGMNRMPTGKLTGDVAFVSARERAAAITPVPGGVGPMTIVYLLENTFRSARLRTLARSIDV